MKNLKKISGEFWTVLLLFLVAILPFFILAAYTYPNLEDYAESIIPEVWWHVKFLYLTYDGRYFVSFLFAALNPLKGSHFILYKLLPPVLLFSLFTALYIAIRTFSSELSKGKAVMLAMIIFAFFLNRNPNIPYSFYYMISSYVYMVPLILYLLFMSLSYKLITAKSYSVLRLSITLLLIFAIAGGNELLLIPVLVWFGILVLTNSKQQVKNNKALGLMFIAIICSFFIVFTSPGIHQYFEDSTTNKDMAFALKAAYNSLNFSIIHLTRTLKHNYSLILGSLLFLILVSKTKQLAFAKLSFSKIALIGTGLFIAYLFLIFPYCWAGGAQASPSYSQAFIISYHFIILSWFIVLFLIGQNIPKERIPSQLFKPVAAIVLVGILCFSFVLDPFSRIKIAYHDLLSGEAKAYHQEMSNNVELSQNSKLYLDERGVLSFCALKHKPTSIYSGVYLNPEQEAFHFAYKSFYKIKKMEVKECP